MNADGSLKRYFPGVVALLVATAAYFQASGLAELVGSKIGGAPASSPSTATPIPARTEAKSGSPILSRNPFDSATGPLDGSAPVAAPTSAPDEPEDEGEPGDEEPACGFGRVVLILASDDPSVSFASIAGSDGTTKLRHVGDQVDDYTVTSMSWDRVWLTKDGARCHMSVGSQSAVVDKPASTPSPARPAGPGALPDEMKNKITKVSDNQYNVERSVLDDILEKQAELMRFTRMQPVKEGDQVVGMRMSRIRSGTLLDVLGLENGDAVQSINGFDLTDPQKALEAYGRLRTASSLKLQVMRNGKSETIEYNIQ
ncbi:MAG: type II secretion system protein GspC [Polyangiaceae bacterium]